MKNFKSFCKYLLIVNFSFSPIYIGLIIHILVFNSQDFKWLAILYAISLMVAFISLMEKLTKKGKNE